MPLVMMAVIGTLSYNFQVVFPLFAKYSLGGSVTTFTCSTRRRPWGR